MPTDTERLDWLEKRFHCYSPNAEVLEYQGPEGSRFPKSVDVALPEVDTYVLWVDKSGYMSIFELDKECGLDWIFQLAKHRRPTHWMPLPDPPEQEG